MALRCLTSSRMTMTATLLHQTDPISGVPTNDIDIDDYGTWTDSQDPLTGEIVRVWKAYDEYVDDPETPEVEPTVVTTIPCIARGVVDGGIRSPGVGENFGIQYDNIDYVRMWVPASVVITKRDRITNIRDRSGKVQWVDSEYFDPQNPGGTLVATVFNVEGVTPLLNPFNQVTEQYVLLSRAEKRGLQ